MIFCCLRAFNSKAATTRPPARPPCKFPNYWKRQPQIVNCQIITSTCISRIIDICICFQGHTSTSPTMHTYMATINAQIIYYTHSRHKSPTKCSCRIVCGKRYMLQFCTYRVLLLIRCPSVKEGFAFRWRFLKQN